MKFQKRLKEPMPVQPAESSNEDFDWQKRFEGMEQIRKRMELLPIDLPPGTDINYIIDQTNES